MPTKLELGQYWDKSLNPLKIKGGGYHCTKCSPGCLNCWAEKYNLRFHNKIPYDSRRVEFVLDEKVLEQPLHRKIPTKYFICDLCDLFHKDVPFEYIDKVIAVFALCPQHIGQILTKRIDRMLEYFKTDWMERVKSIVKQKHYNLNVVWPGSLHFTRKILLNLWLGISVENQKRADERIPLILQMSAAVRFVSIEPLLEEIDITRIGGDRFGWGRIDVLNGLRYMRANALEEGSEWETEPCEKLNQVIIGCEFGAKRRECKMAWVGDLVGQCKAANVPVFVKQLSINGKVSHDPKEWPEDLRIREYPEDKS